jgi:hypothetical protein
VSDPASHSAGAAVDFEHRHKRFRVRITADGALELYLDGCLRKRREPGEREPRYVWTNVELEWEEHHYVEARYWPSDGRLRVDVNRQPVLERRLTE